MLYPSLGSLVPGDSSSIPNSASSVLNRVNAESLASVQRSSPSSTYCIGVDITLRWYRLWRNKSCWSCRLLELVKWLGKSHLLAWSSTHLVSPVVADDLMGDYSGAPQLYKPRYPDTTSTEARKIKKMPC